MPGIAGILGGRDEDAIRVAVERMVGSMRHEPWYNSGCLVEGAMGAGIGWVCHAGSFCDCLPIWNATKDICLVFYGENYADEAEISGFKRATGLGCKVDARYLVNQYEALGADFLKTLNGWYAGLILDLRERKAIIFNDRFGLCRIYYHQAAGGLYFASEAKALLAVLPDLRGLDMRSLGEFLSCGCVLQDRSLFSGISTLPAGSGWSWRLQEGLRKSCYFEARDWERDEPLESESYYECLRSTFTRVLPRYFQGGTPIAMSLTGGLDSRMIVAWARCEPGAFPCITHSGMFRECADARISGRVASVLGQPHRVVRVGDEFLREFPKLAIRSVYLTDGTMDTSGSVGVFVNRLARDTAAVRMTGNYGSEILRWLVAFKAGGVCGAAFDASVKPWIAEAATTYAGERQGSVRRFIVSKQTAWHHHCRFSLESSQLTVRSPFLDNELVALAFRAPDSLRANQDFSARLIADGNPRLAEFATDLGPLGRPGPLGRLSESWQTFTFKAEYAYDYGMPQWLARIDHAFAPLHLERLFLGRHKYYHFRVWYRDQLSRFVKEYLLDPRTLGRGYLNGREVRNLVEQHAAGTGNFTLEIHKLLTLEMIQRELIERI